jgi:hypothetical protein
MPHRALMSASTEPPECPLEAEAVCHEQPGRALAPDTSPPNPNRRLSALGSGARAELAMLLVFGLLLLLLLVTGLPICPTAGILGVPCPGCGMTRAALSLFSGHPLEALRHNPSVFLVLPGLMGWGGLAQLQRRRRARGLGSWPLFERATLWGTLGIGVAMVALWGLRFFGYFGGPEPVSRWGSHLLAPDVSSWEAHRAAHDQRVTPRARR